jgi:hypothetical protein
MFRNSAFTCFNSLNTVGGHIWICCYVIQIHNIALPALQTHTAEKAMTVDTLKHLLAALESCPGEDVIAEAPKALRSSVELMPHQKNALAWLMWRESHKPYGGILGMFLNLIL